MAMFGLQCLKKALKLKAFAEKEGGVSQEAKERLDPFVRLLLRALKGQVVQL